MHTSGHDLNLLNIEAHNQFVTSLGRKCIIFSELDGRGLKTKLGSELSKVKY